MPEIKHTFHAGKMNKDVDERLVPNGEYRDALNIQVRTTSNGDAGAVQNIQGNSKVGESYKTRWTPAPVNGQLQTASETTCIGSIADEKNDTAYFFMAAPVVRPPSVTDIDYNNEKIFVDSIIEQHVDGTTSIIVADRFKIYANSTETLGEDPEEISEASAGWVELKVADASKYRVGMVVRAKAVVVFPFGAPPMDLLFNEEGEAGATIRSIDTVNNIITFSSVQYEQVVNIADAWIFEHPKMLEFNPNTIITSINIIDNLLFWTDGENEPKKINIERCREGSNQDDFSAHTKLYVSNPSYPNDNLVDISTIENTNNTDLLKKHITVIREAPTIAPTLIMKESDRDGNTSTNITYNFLDLQSSPSLPMVGVTRIISIDEELAYEPGDILTFTSVSTATEVYSNILVMKAIITEGGIEQVTGGVVLTLQMLNVDPDFTVNNSSVYQEWVVRLEQKKPIYHLKLGRFAYRYKYDDGEYSSFSPWSELAFLPSRFSYTPSKGFNNGMVNNLRRLTIKDFIPHDSIRPNDVKTIDILYKTTDSPTVYVVKSITREVDPEWELFSGGENENTGSFTLTSEMIHSVVPSNQILRAWDNVPLKAVAQEVTGNRLIYGNYTQGYNLRTAVGLEQMLNSSTADLGHPSKSVKSLRNYKWGMVFGDKYGRETPVISSGYVTGLPGSTTTVAGDITISKEYAASANSFKLKQNWGSDAPPKYFDYVKYYVKETTNEYYNLIMDRWYDAKDNNIWLSFPSADRNKVDEETYLILKNQHGSQSPVVEKARYRIISIKNEAPDYIKTDSRNCGKVLINNDSVYGDWTDDDTASAEPTLLMNETEITISPGNWDAVDGAGGMVSSDFKGTPKVRVFAKFLDTDFETELSTASSKWVTLSRLKREVDTSSGETSINGVVLKEKFGSSANLFSIFLGLSFDLSQANVVTSNGSRIKYYLEFKDEVVENKPEFDGRFFVKIERDTGVEKNIMLLSTSDYDIVDSYDIAYIESKQLNPAQDGANNQSSLAGTEWDASSAGMGANNFTAANVDSQLGREGYENETTQFWSDWYNSSNRPAKIFIDGARAMTTTVQPLNHSVQGNSWMLWNGESNYEFGSPVSLENFNTYNALTNNSIINPNTQEPIYEAFGGECWFPQVDLPNGLLAFNDSNQLLGVLEPGYLNFTPYGPDPNPQNAFNITGNLSTSIGSGAFHNPHTALHDGKWSDIAEYFIHPDSGTLGQLTFSALSVGTCSDDGWPVDIIGFRNKMRSVGTRFRFRSDPSGHIYEVIKIVNLDESAYYWYSSQAGGIISNPNIYGGYSYNYQNVWDDEMSSVMWLEEEDNYGYGNKHRVRNASYYNFTTNETGIIGADDSEVGWRSSFICRFRRVDAETGSIAESETTYAGYQTTAEGINVTEWDPRGSMRHDGSSSTIIDIISKSIDNDDDDEETFSIGACWETEPKKKETDLELYYEASSSIPMVLNEENITIFAPSKSRTSSPGLFTIADRVLNQLDDNGNATFTEQVNIISTNGQPFVNDINGLAIQLMQGSNPYTTNVRIDDVIVFEHANGDKTRTKIVDYYIIENDVAIPAKRRGPYPVFAQNIIDNGAELGTLVIVNPADYGLAFSTNPVSPNYPVGMHVYDVDPLAFDFQNTYIEKGASITAITQTTFGVYTVTQLYLDKPISNFTSTWAYQNMTAILIEPTGWYKLDQNVWNYSVELSWFNCYSYGNGVESNRIGDDFNAPQIDNGVKVSTTFLEYNEETRGSGLIYSGLYNSTSGVNNLNEFNMAEKITKDLNPVYGSIQALKTRDTDVVVFTEDKVLKVLSNKDAVFNADGNAQLTATNRVLGTAIPFTGDYGISKNPESLAWDQYRLYFTDKQRGAVLRLSNDGLTPISNVGMKSWFRDHLKACESIVGTFDKVNGEYNVTLKTSESLLPEDSDNWKYKDITVSFNEGSKGWVSFKSFVPKTGCSVSGKYFTSIDNEIWEHHYKTPSSLSSNLGEDTNKNRIYGSLKESSITIIFNDLPSVVKSFKTINYEGTKSKVNKFSDESVDPYSIFYEDDNNWTDGEYYNLSDKQGWWVESFTTDLQNGSVPEFINKEDKWFNKINGKNETYLTGSSINYSEFAVQGIGFPTRVVSEAPNNGYIIIQNDPNG